MAADSDPCVDIAEEDGLKPAQPELADLLSVFNEYGFVLDVVLVEIEGVGVGSDLLLYFLFLFLVLCSLLVLLRYFSHMESGAY